MTPGKAYIPESETNGAVQIASLFKFMISKLLGNAILTMNKHAIFFRETELELDAFHHSCPRGPYLGLSPDGQ